MKQRDSLFESKLSQERSLAQILGNAEKMATDMACAILAGGRPFKIWGVHSIKSSLCKCKEIGMATQIIKKEGNKSTVSTNAQYIHDTQ